jgi:O-methyltransferase involved in polyketide biosynthesis
MTTSNTADRPDGAPHLTLNQVQCDFPQFRIWRAFTPHRTSYVARRVYPCPGPHTVVTADLAELRSVLSAAGPPGEADVPFDPKTPNIARMYAYLLGGKDHFPADRSAAQQILDDFPEVAQAARANRRFVTRAVQYVAEQGVTQFIDVGAGLPVHPTVHGTAQRVDPAARIAYVDNDPLVLVQAQALLAGPGVVAVLGDLRDPAAILAHPELSRLLDLAKPICVLLASVLHFLPPAQADATVAAFRAALVPGSYLVISSGTSTGTNPALLDRLRSVYANTSDITGRPAEEIAAWLTGWDRVSPGLVDVDAWRPGHDWHWPSPAAARILVAVARRLENSRACTEQ